MLHLSATLEAQAAELAEGFHEAGLQANATGDAAAALRAFSRAIAVDSAPKYVLSAANMKLKLGDALTAVADYTELLTGALSAGPRTLTATQREMAERKLADARALLPAGSVGAPSPLAPAPAGAVAAPPEPAVPPAVAAPSELPAPPEPAGAADLPGSKYWNLKQRILIEVLGASPQAIDEDQVRCVTRRLI